MRETGPVLVNTHSVPAPRCSPTPSRPSGTDPQLERDVNQPFGSQEGVILGVILGDYIM